MRRVALVVGVVVALGTLAGLLLAGASTTAGASVLSGGADGWRGARAYLDARGVDTSAWAEPLVDLPGEGVLALGFPWQSRALDLGDDAVLRHLDNGGSLVVAYSGGYAPQPVLVVLFELLGVEVDRFDDAISLVPWRWYRQVREPWRLSPTPALAAGEALSMQRPRWLPRPPDGATTLLTGSGGESVVTTWPARRGRVVLLPAEVLSNARLGEEAHAAWLETLVHWLGRRWVFDEYHHGLGVTSASATHGGRLGFDLLLVQLGLFYLAGLLVLARRMGPAWRERPVITGSAGSFLMRLGRLHDRLGHADPAAALLVERAGRLDRRLDVRALRRQRMVASGSESLLAQARAVGRSQATWRKRS